jgi:hypothetical protein
VDILQVRAERIKWLPKVSGQVQWRFGDRTSFLAGGVENWKCVWKISVFLYYYEVRRDRAAGKAIGCGLEDRGVRFRVLVW